MFHLFGTRIVSILNVSEVHEAAGEVRRMLIASKGGSGSEWLVRQKQEETNNTSRIRHHACGRFYFELYLNDVYF